MVWDKVKNRIYQRMYRQYRGKNFPHALFQKQVSLERMKEKMMQLSVDPLKSRQKTKQTYKGVNVSPQKRERVLEDFFVDPSTIPKSKREQLDEFLDEHHGQVDYVTLMRKMREIDENA